SDGAPSDGAPSDGAPSDRAPSDGAPSVRLDDWEIGARTLPLRDDGFGEVRRTPPQLRVRRMPTVESLPPPPDDTFRSSVRRIGPAVRERMGTSWEPGCPVPLRGLRYVRVSFWGFDERPHTGELVVAARHAEPIAGVFEKLYAARFPIEQMTLPTSAERDPTPSGDGNGTGATVCRAVTGATSYSEHAYGLAIDVNPFQNPYHRGDLVIPELASAYLDRDRQRPGMIRADGLVVRAFAEIGWSWGGAWNSLKDYQHFSATGR
ncbi:MAG: M15 family metallopeptidase, partial [Nocardioides sp.]